MGQGAKPVCTFCQQPNFVWQITIRGVLTFLHFQCARRYEKSIEPLPTFHAQ